MVQSVYQEYQYFGIYHFSFTFIWVAHQLYNIKSLLIHSILILNKINISILIWISLQW